MAIARRFVVLLLRWLVAGPRRASVEAEVRRLVFRLVAIGPGRTVFVGRGGVDRATGVTSTPLRAGDREVHLPRSAAHPEEHVRFGPRAVHRLQGFAHAGSGLVFIGDAVVSESGGITQARGRLTAVHWVPREFRALAAAGALDAVAIGPPVLPVGRVLGRNYYHWIVEVLPAVVRVAELEPSVRVLVPSDAPVFVTRSLQVLGFDVVVGDRYHGPGEVILVDAPVQNWPHPDDLAALVGRVDSRFGAPQSEPPATVYVSRRGVRRELRGEAELEERLRAAGFSIFVGGDWRDDVRLFRRASVIVGPHGAGLTNAVFAPPGARLVEFSTERLRHAAFRRLAVVRGLAYDHIDLASTPTAPDGDAADAARALAGLGLLPEGTSPGG